MFKILNCYDNIDSNIFFEIKEIKITRGHKFTQYTQLQMSTNIVGKVPAMD